MSILIKKRFYNKEEIQEIKESVRVEDIMEAFGYEPNKAGYYECPNPEHNDIHPSARITDEKKFCNCLTCFSCPDLAEKEVNIIDNLKLVEYLTGERNFIKKVNWLIDFANDKDIVIEKKKVITESKSEIKEEENEDFYKKQIDFALKSSKTIHQLHTEHKYFIDEYLSKRGIKYERIKDFLALNKIEIRHNYYNDINSCLINIDNKQIIQRQIEDYLQDNPEKPHGKFVKGHNSYTYLNNNNKELMIFEGFYDFLSYLSIMEVSDFSKTDFVVLNSVRNVNKLLTENDLEKYEVVGIFTDNDNAGRKAAEEIQNKLNKPCVMCCFPENKDWNEDIVQMMNIKRETRIFKKGLK